MKKAVVSTLLAPLFCFAGIKSIAEPKTKWFKNNVTVCWQNADEKIPQIFSPAQADTINTLPSPWEKPTDEIKALIKQTINSQYHKKSTGIYFDGWESCDQSPYWDLMIVTSNSETSELHGRTLFGQGVSVNEIEDEFPVDYSQRKSFLYFNLHNLTEGLSDEDHMRLTTVHEFGHVAGLRHEHARDESLDDPLCAEIPTFETSSLYSKIVGQYDPTSVMSYCFLELLSKQGLVINDSKAYSTLTDQKIVKRVNNKIHLSIGLSSGDQRTLQCLYFSKEQLKDIDCSPK